MTYRKATLAIETQVELSQKVEVLLDESKDKPLK